MDKLNNLYKIDVQFLFKRLKIQIENLYASLSNRGTGVDSNVSDENFSTNQNQEPRSDDQSQDRNILMHCEGTPHGSYSKSYIASSPHAVSQQFRSHSSITNTTCYNHYKLILRLVTFCPLPYPNIL